jgi:hypothetical protein
MVEGDSASFLINPSVLFRRLLSIRLFPIFANDDTLVKLNVKLIQIISKARVSSTQKKLQKPDDVEDTELQELQLIDSYLLQRL